MKTRTKEYLQRRMIAQLLAINVSNLRTFGASYYHGNAQGFASALLAVDALDINTYCRLSDCIGAIAKKAVK